MSAMIRLMWKEYRALRGLWLALAIFGLVCDAMVFFFTDSLQERLPGIFGFAGVLPTGFALGAGAMLFALEREDATYELLRCLPTTSPRVFAAKVFTALIGSLLLGFLLVAVALGDMRAMAAWPNIDHSILTGPLGYVLIYALLVVQGLGWSVFFSLQSSRPLLAALLGAIGASSCIGLVHGATENLGLAKLGGTWDSPTMHLLATLAIWSADVWLGSRWLRARRAKRQSRSEGEKAMKRLLWQEWRGSRRMLLVVVALGVFVPVALWPLFIPLTVLGFALLGASTFLSDQERRQFRFFAERGVSPRRLWFSRQLFWGGAALSLAAVLFLAERLWASLVLASPNEAERLLKLTGWVFEPLNYLVWVALAFAAGQACSMFLQSGVLAATLGVVFAGLLAGWMALIHALDIGLWWSVAPLAAALFAATWLRSNDWLVERHTWRSWAPAILAPLATFAALLVAVPAYRVWEIPAPVMALEISPRPKPSAEAAFAASRLQRLCESFSSPSSAGLGANYEALRPLYHPANSTLEAKELEWLKDNEETLKRVISVLDELPRDATIAGGAPRSSPHLGFDAIGAMILRYGQMAERDGHLNEAWRRYQAVFKLAAFAWPENGVRGEFFGDSLVTAAAMQLMRWGAQKGQTDANLRTAIAALRQSEAADPPLAEIAMNEYREYVEIIDAAVARPDESDPPLRFFAKWAPWEIARLRRLYRYEASRNVHDARPLDKSLAGLADQMIDWTSERNIASESTFWRTSPMPPLIEISVLAPGRLSAVCCRRAAQLVLAVEAWILEHGAPPKKLDELRGTYFDSLPLDPYTFNHRTFEWFPWGLSAPVKYHSTAWSTTDSAAKLAAGTPFIYGASGGNHTERATLERLGRRSADE
ncbi:MAG TPA: hypothetical protein VF278_19775, partial [Pirellulales bacterium]